MSEGERREASSEEAPGRENRQRGETVKFAILVLILAGTVLAVAAARPLVFNRIVPAVLGWTTPDAEGAQPPLEPTEMPTTVDNGVSPATPTATTTPIPPTATPRIHVVQPGDNLTQIAERYGVTIDAILRANQLENANRIYPGQRLVIPDS